MSAYTHRVAIACHEALLAAGNNLAACMGLSLADLHTFESAHYQDAQGNRYAVCSAATTPRVLLAAAAKQVQRPAWDTTERIDLEAAAQAMAALIVDAVPAMPGAITAVVDIDAMQAIEIMGLTPVPSDGD